MLICDADERRNINRNISSAPLSTFMSCPTAARYQFTPTIFSCGNSKNGFHRGHDRCYLYVFDLKKAKKKKKGQKQS